MKGKEDNLKFLVKSAVRQLLYWSWDRAVTSDSLNWKLNISNYIKIILPRLSRKSNYLKIYLRNNQMIHMKYLKLLLIYTASCYKTWWMIL